MKSKKFTITPGDINTSLPFKIDLRLTIVRTNNNGIVSNELWYPTQCLIRNTSGVNLEWLAYQEADLDPLTGLIPVTAYYDFLPIDNGKDLTNTHMERTDLIYISNASGYLTTPAISDMYVYAFAYHKVPGYT